MDDAGIVRHSANELSEAKIKGNLERTMVVFRLAAEEESPWLLLA